MPTTATILSPIEGDTVASPVAVSAAYITDAIANIKLTCNVGAYAGTEGNHAPPSGPHGSGNIAAPGGNPYTLYTVQIKDTTGAPTVLHSESNVKVTSGTRPVQIDGIAAPPPGPPAAPAPAPPPAAVQNRTRNFDGRCDPAKNVAYVIVRVYEVNVTNHNRTVIAAGADTVKVTGNQHKWQVQLKFDMDTGDANLQYVGRATAYDKNDAVIGVVTEVITK